MVEEFEGSRSAAEDHHQEQKHGFQSAFTDDDPSFEEMGNLTYVQKKVLNKFQYTKRQTLV